MALLAGLAGHHAGWAAVTAEEAGALAVTLTPLGAENGLATPTAAFPPGTAA